MMIEMRDTLNEVNVQNARLLYTNRGVMGSFVRVACKTK